MQPNSTPHFWTARVTALTFLAAIVGWAVLVARWPLADATVPWDSKNHFYAMLRFLAEHLREGEIPLWNPFHFSGFPTAADPQSLLFTPTLLALAALDPAPSLTAFDMAVFAHLLVGALALVAYFRVKGWHPLGALLAALVYAFGGSAAMRLQHTGMIVSYGLFPLALVLLDIALDRRSYRAAIAFGIVAALMALGRDQVAFLFCLMLVAVLVTKLAAHGRPLKALRERAGVLAAMALTGAAILAVPVLLTLQLLAQSNRPEIAFAAATRGSLHPVSLATLIAPDIFGGYSDMYRYWGPHHGTTGGRYLTDASINQIFAGSLTILLVLWHGIAGRRLAERPIRFWALAGLFALLYALGSATPIFEFLFDWLPGVKLYRRPADATFLFNFVLAILAGYLAHRWIVEGAPRPSRLGLIAAGAIVLGLVGWAVGFSAISDRVRAALDDAALALFLAGVGGAALFAAIRPRWRPTLAAAALLLATVELGWRNTVAALNAEPRSVYAFLEAPRPAEQRLLDSLEGEIEQRQAVGDRPRVEMVGVPGPWMNAPMVHGLEVTLGYNPLRLGDYQRAVGPGENAADLSLRTFPRTFRTYDSRLAHLLGLEYVVLDRPKERLPAHFPRIQGDPVFAGGGAWVYRLKGPAAPRAYVATQVRVVDTEVLLASQDIPAFEVGREALVDTETPPRRAYRDPERRRRCEARIKAYRANSVEIEAETDGPGLLVLHDIHYPGWIAEVNGERLPILRANLLFRGVELPAAGHYRVVFRFEPLSLENLAAAAEAVLGLAPAPEPAAPREAPPSTTLARAP